MSTDEEKISRLYQQDNNEAPPAQLDSAIMKAAHEAVEIKPSSAKSPFSGGWPAATAIAAVLIITVILVPLVKQETPPATSAKIADDSRKLMFKQDEIGRSNVEKTKKRSLSKEQERRITQAPQKTPPTALRHDQQFSEEEIIVPKRAKAALPSTQQAKPSSAIAGKSTIQAYELKSGIKSEPKQKNLHDLAADDESTTTLTPEMWLKKIQQLIEQNKLDLAQEELGNFRAHYPDEEIEQSILNSLKSHSGLN